MQHTCCFLDRVWSRGQEDWINYLMSQAAKSQDFLLSVLLLTGTCPFIWQFSLNRKKHLSHWLFCCKLQTIHVHRVAFSSSVTGQLVHFIYFNLFCNSKTVNNGKKIYWVLTMCPLLRGGLDTKISLNPHKNAPRWAVGSPTSFTGENMDLLKGSYLPEVTQLESSWWVRSGWFPS